ncbi:MAG: CDP-glycerol glycerophosphotransferase family protein [Candidatus Marinimicrobia bacterium]|nr:CDP-glycerol glycerophosphotransferase family protein [Candidatus Neomarinimicrobiota bacterium]
MRKEQGRDQFPFDYYFIDGDLWLRKLMQYKELNIREDQIVRTGNLRFDDVVNGKMDRSKILKNFGVKDMSRPNILYAPTWKLCAGTLMKHSYSFIEQFSNEYNLFIRPHYYDWRRLGSIRKFIKTGKYKNVYIVEPWNIRTEDTMENLFISDLLISDNSSISYQSLIFTMPVLQIYIDESNIDKQRSEFDIRNIVDCWNGKGSILPLVKGNLQKNKYKTDLQSLLKKCFYFNDGKCTERAVSFIKSMSH